MSTAKKQPREVKPIAATPQQVEAMGRIYAKLAAIFKYPFRVELSHVMDGRPTIVITIWPPFAEMRRYDAVVQRVVKDEMPEGYLDDGLSGDCQSNDRGEGERIYFLIPDKREEAALRR